MLKESVMGGTFMIQIENIGSEIHIFGRDKDRKPYHKVVEDFRPYFYVPSSTPTGTKSIFGDDVKKVVCDSPKEVPFLRDKEDKTFEADIVYVNRFIIDRYDVIPKESLRNLYLDIEIEVLDEFPDIEKANNQILAISCYDNFNDRFITFAVDPNDEYPNRNIRKGNYIDVYRKTEKEMLKEFIKFFKATDPDLIIGWNLVGFDAVYIQNRFKRLKLGSLSRIRKHFWAGRVLFDLMVAYKHLSQGGRESYSLEYISQYELGEGKEKFDGTWDDLYKLHFQKYISYNKRDVELLKLLDEKLHIVDTYDERRRLAFCRFDDVFMNSRVIDQYMLKFCLGKFVLPTKDYDNKTESVEGAFVLDPKKGLFRNVIVVDLASLYPNTIMQFNISPDTISNEGYALPSGVTFAKSPKGIFPSMLDELFGVRKKYKALMKQCEYGSDEYKAYDLIQYSSKVILNSIFGVSNFASFRLRDSRVTASITRMGKELIIWSKKFIESKGYEVIAADTDSLFIHLDENLNIDEVECIGKQIEVDINAILPKFIEPYGCTENRYEFEFEKVCKTIFFTAKKRYCYLNEKNEVVVYGHSQKRSDSPQIARDFQKELFRQILNGVAETTITKFIREFATSLETKTPEEIALPISVKNKSEYKSDSAYHLKAVAFSNKHLGMNIKFGKAKLMYVKPTNNWRTETVAFTDKFPDGFDIDYKKMKDRLVYNNVERIYDSLGWIFKKNDGIAKWLTKTSQN